MENLELCPCFEHKEFTDLDQNDETPAQRGTRLHAAVQFEDLSKCNDDEERELVQRCIDVSRVLSRSKDPSIPTIYKEIRVDIFDICKGTLDLLIIWDDNTAAILDYKFIRADTVTSPETNLQLACYAAGVMLKFPNVTSVNTGILAPAIGYMPDLKSYARADLDAIASPASWKNGTTRSRNPGPEINVRCVRCLSGAPHLETL